MNRVRPILLTCALLSSGAAEAQQIGLVETFLGACEPSGALAMIDAAADLGFLVANDEDNVLRIYLPGDSTPATITGDDLNSSLGLDASDEDQKVDFEAAARIGGRSFLIGSHSRSKKGNRRPSRETFLSLAVTGEPDALQVSVSKPATLLSSLALIEALKNSIALDDKKHETLAPEVEGLNIEGLAEGLDGKSALIGMRNPLTDKGEAIVVPLLNPVELVDDQAAPELGDPHYLDLGRRGIRSMEHSPGTGGYLISAGPNQTSGTFALYTWSGVKGEAAKPMEAENALLSSLDRFQTEALYVDPTGGTIRLFSDDGDLTDASGIPCQERTDPAAQHFRSVVLSLP